MPLDRRNREGRQPGVAPIGGKEVALKRVYRDPAGIRLQPANPEMEPWRPGPGEVEILAW
jgi:repressor LexA